MKTIKLKKPTIPYDGWAIESDINQKTVDLSKVVLHLDEGQKNGGYITGTKLLKELKGKNPLSAAVLDYLIEHPEETPEAWKENTLEGITQFIYFFGTIYRSRSGGLCVRCWCWCEGRWQSRCSWLDGGWDGSDPSALLASSQSSDPSSSSDLDTSGISDYAKLSDIEARLTKVEDFQERFSEAFSKLCNLLTPPADTVEGENL